MVNARNGPWTPDEDQLLISYVANHGERHWDSVQKHTGLSRSGHSCRIRWKTNLKPGLKKGPLTNEEEQQLIRLHASFGNKWSRIASHLPGRSDHEIRLFFNAKKSNQQPLEVTGQAMNTEPQQPRQISDSLDRHAPVTDLGISYLQGNQSFSYMPSMDYRFSTGNVMRPIECSVPNNMNNFITYPSIPSRKRTREPETAFPFMNGYAMNKKLRLPPLQSLESHDWRTQLSNPIPAPDSYNSWFQARPTGQTPPDYRLLQPVGDNNSLTRLLFEEVPAYWGPQLSNPMFQSPSADQTPSDYGLLQPLVYGSSEEMQATHIDQSSLLGCTEPIPASANATNFGFSEELACGSSRERQTTCTNPEPMLLQSSLLANAAYCSPSEPHLGAQESEFPSIQERFDSQEVPAYLGTQLSNPVLPFESDNTLFQSLPTDQTQPDYGLLQPFVYGSSGERQATQIDQSSLLGNTQASANIPGKSFTL